MPTVRSNNSSRSGGVRTDRFAKTVARFTPFGLDLEDLQWWLAAAMRAVAFSILVLLGGACRTAETPSGVPEDGVKRFMGVDFGRPPPPSTSKEASEPPASDKDLLEFHTMTPPQAPFGFESAGVALVKNSDLSKENGIVFEKTGVVWGAVFSKAHEGCNEAEYDQLIATVLEGRSALHESRNRRDTAAGVRIDGRVVTSRALWTLRCTPEQLMLSIRDVYILKWCGNDDTKKFFDKNWEGFTATLPPPQ